METTAILRTHENSTPQDRPLLAMMSLWLRDMAASLAAQGMQEAAELCTKAMGVIRAELAAKNTIPNPAVAAAKAA